VSTPLSREERLREFFKRLGEQAPSRTAEEALQRVVRTLDEVEDAYSGVPKSDPTSQSVTTEVLRLRTGRPGKSNFNRWAQGANMALAVDFARFADELRKSPHGFLVEISFFPSGALSMRVDCGSRLFDLDYFPAESLFCVDELESDAGFNTGYRFGFDNLEHAKAKLLELLGQVHGENSAAVDESAKANSRP
jgi:hypothetical protein